MEIAKNIRDCATGTVMEEQLFEMTDGLDQSAKKFVSWLERRIEHYERRVKNGRKDIDARLAHDTLDCYDWDAIARKAADMARWQGKLDAYRHALDQFVWEFEE